MDKAGNTETIKMSKADWLKRGEELFGPLARDWRFVCPSCGNIQTLLEVVEAGGKEESGYFNCIGRYLDKCGDIGSDTPPCNYTSGGIIRLNTMFVITDDGKEHPVFRFDESPDINEASE